MIGQTSCNSWRTLNPTVPETADGQLETQAMVRMTEIVQAANHIHASLQGLNFASRGASSPGKAIQTLAKGSIEALDESGIDATCALRLLDDGLDNHFTALHDASRDVQLPIHSLLDDLHNGDIGPGNQLRATHFTLAAWQRSPKCFAKGCHVARQTIDGQQQWTAERHIPDLVRQNLDQIQVAVRADRTTQPQTGRYHDR
jgi:hypothetical protein